MSKTICGFMRNEIKKGLDQLKPESVAMFHRMYPMGVDLLPEDRLNTALDQVLRSLEKIHLRKEAPDHA